MQYYSGGKSKAMPVVIFPVVNFYSITSIDCLVAICDSIIMAPSVAQLPAAQLKGSFVISLCFWWYVKSGMSKVKLPVVSFYSTRYTDYLVAICSAILATIMTAIISVTQAL